MTKTKREIPPPHAGAILLKGGHSRYDPDIWLVEHEGARAVLKTYARRPIHIRNTIGRWITRREARNLKRLKGVKGVPQYISRDNPWALTMSYIDGESLPKSKENLEGYNEEWFATLERVIRDMHERGVNHGDVRRTNILRERGTGQPYLVDFAQSLNLSNPRTFIGRYIRRHAFEVDMVTLTKLKGWYAGYNILSDEEKYVLRNPPRLLAAGRFLKKRIYKPVRRFGERLFGSNRS